MFLTLHNYDIYWLCVFSCIVSFYTSYTFVLRIGYRLTVIVHCSCVFCLSVAVLANKVYQYFKEIDTVI